MLCDDTKGNHWGLLSRGDGKFIKDLGRYKTGFCGHSGSYTLWADLDGDGRADMNCDDTKGKHWTLLMASGSVRTSRNVMRGMKRMMKSSSMTRRASPVFKMSNKMATLVDAE